MFDGEKMIGTVSATKLDKMSCELKSLYLLERYHGMGYGKSLLQKAIALYRRTGFADTEKYNSSERSDIFMVLDLKDKF